MHPITGKVQTYVENHIWPHMKFLSSVEDWDWSQLCCWVCSSLRGFSPYAKRNQKIPHLYAKENVIKLLWEKLQRQVSLPTPEKVCMSEYMKMEKKVRIEVRRKIEPERLL